MRPDPGERPRRVNSLPLDLPIVPASAAMTVLKTWEDFEKAAERLYLQDPMRARYNIKYDHGAGTLHMKMTDDAVCLQYKSDAAQDVKKMERFVNNLMRHMASKEQH